MSERIREKIFENKNEDSRQINKWLCISSDYGKVLSETVGISGKETLLREKFPQNNKDQNN